MAALSVLSLSLFLNLRRRYSLSLLSHFTAIYSVRQSLSGNSNPTIHACRISCDRNHRTDRLQPVSRIACGRSHRTACSYRTNHHRPSVNPFRLVFFELARSDVGSNCCWMATEHFDWNSNRTEADGSPDDFDRYLFGHWILFRQRPAMMMAEWRWLLMLSPAHWTSMCNTLRIKSTMW